MSTIMQTSINGVSFPSAGTGRGRRGFTLLEVLAVIVIMGVIAAVMLPGLAGITSQSKLQSSAAPLVGSIREARQYAITHGQETHVVFCMDRGTAINAQLYGTNGEARQRFLRGFTVYTENDGYVSEWSLLPEGYVFDPTESGSVGEDDAYLKLVKAANWGSGASGDAFDVELHAVTFRPDGTTTQAGTNAKIHIVRGLTNAAVTSEATVTYELIPNQNKMIISINSLTGATRISEELP